MPLLTDAERVLYTRYLNEARAAYHSLATGQMARVFVDQNAERVEYAAGNRNLLGAYINELERKLGLSTTSGPMGFLF